MGFGSLWHWAIVLVIVVVLFGGRGKISELMGDVAKGIKSFKKGMSDDETKAADTQTIDHEPAQTVSPDRAEQKTKVG
jgi:sec-independent protein translocase protein TatA